MEPIRDHRTSISTLQILCIYGSVQVAGRSQGLSLTALYMVRLLYTFKIIRKEKNAKLRNLLICFINSKNENDLLFYICFRKKKILFYMYG